MPCKLARKGARCLNANYYMYVVSNGPRPLARGARSLDTADGLFVPEKLEEKIACKFSTLKFSEGCLDPLETPVLPPLKIAVCHPSAHSRATKPTMSGWMTGGGAQRKRARQAGASGAAFHGELSVSTTPKAC